MARGDPDVRAAGGNAPAFRAVRRRADAGAGFHHAVLTDDGVLHRGAGLDGGAGHQHAVDDLGAPLHGNGGRKNGVLNLTVNLTALCDNGVDNAGVLAGIGRGAHRAAGADGPGGIIEVNELRGEHVHVGVPEAGDGADVPPVALEAVGPELFAVCEHGGDDVLSEILAGIGILLVGDQVGTELLPVENVNAHGSQITLGVLGLLFELADIPVLTQVHNAEAGGLLHGNLQNRDGAGGVFLNVLTQHGGIVHFVDVVTGENQHVVGVVAFNEPHVLINGVGRAGEPGAFFSRALIGRKNVDAAVGNVQVPGLADADIAVKLQGFVLRQNADGVDAGVCAVGQGKVNDAILPAKGDAGFCHILCQSIQA